MTTRGLFESAKLRAHRRNGGVRVDSAGFRHYIKKFQYREMDRGAIFGEKIMNAFAGINTGIEMPPIFQDDETACYSLSQVLLPRKSPFVVEKIGRDEPREKIFENNEVWQYDAQRDESRPARTIRSDDVTEEFYQMAAQEMLQRERGDADKPETRVLASGSNFASGTPQKKTPEAPRVAARLAQAAGDRHDPPADFAVSLVIEKAPSGPDIDRVITRLKRLLWVRNPYFIKDLDWSAMVDMAVTVAMDMFVEEDVHMVTDLDPASFWPVIEPLVRGKIFTAKQKAKQQLKQICGNEYGAVEETHNYLRQVHDLVRYLGHMQTSLAKLRSIEKHDQYVCLDDEDYMLHVIKHVDPFMQCERIYNERKGTSNPYTFELLFNEVQDKVRAGTVDRAKETRASVLKHKGNGTRGDGAGGSSNSSSRFNNFRSLPAPEDLFEQKKGFVDRQNLPSGRDYGGDVSYGQSFDYHRNQTPNPGSKGFHRVEIDARGDDRRGDDRRGDDRRGGDRRGSDRRGGDRRDGDQRPERFGGGGRGDDHRGRNAGRGRSYDRRGTPDRGASRSRSRSRDKSPAREEHERKELQILRNRPQRLSTEAGLLTEGFGRADRVHGGGSSGRRDPMVVHHCANCDYLDYSLHQSLRSLAYQHSMETCLRPGGGAFGSDHRSAMSRQGVLDNMLLADHAKNSSNARVQRGQKLLAIDHGDSDGG